VLSNNVKNSKNNNRPLLALLSREFSTEQTNLINALLKFLQIILVHSVASFCRNLFINAQEMQFPTVILWAVLLLQRS